MTIVPRNWTKRIAFGTTMSLLITCTFSRQRVASFVAIRAAATWTTTHPPKTPYYGASKPLSTSSLARASFHCDHIHSQSSISYPFSSHLKREPLRMAPLCSTDWTPHKSSGALSFYHHHKQHRLLHSYFPTTTTTTCRPFYQNLVCYFHRHYRHGQQQQQQQQQQLRTFSSSTLTRTAVRRMKVADIRAELESRSLDTEGNRTLLMTRLLDALEKDNPPDPQGTKNNNSPSKAPSKGKKSSQAQAKHGMTSPLNGGTQMTMSGQKSDKQEMSQEEATTTVTATTTTPIPSDATGKKAVEEQQTPQPSQQPQQHVGMPPNGDAQMTIPPQEQEQPPSFQQQQQSEVVPEPATPSTAPAEEPTPLVKYQIPFVPDPIAQNPINSNINSTEPILIDPTRTYILRFDGGSRGNPGIAGAGMALFDDQDQEIWCGWKFHEELATNNVAEYLGLWTGLKFAKAMGIQKLIVEGDSQLIVRQIKGEYRCKETTLKKYFYACKDLAREMESFEIRHIRREFNKRADELANHAMNVHGSSSSFDF